MTPDKLATVKANIAASEGRVPWLYRDSGPEGALTCGVGHKVSDYLACQSLPFSPPITAAEWAALMVEPKACRASFYQAVTKGRLSDVDIDTILDADVASKIAQLTAVIYGYENLPDGPQAALLDMAFNLGVGGLTKGYPKLMAAVKSGDWQTAAAECHRNGISADRNQQTANLFLEGA